LAHDHLKDEKCGSQKGLYLSQGENGLFDLHKLNFETARLKVYLIYSIQQQDGTNPNFETLIRVINFTCAIWTKANLHVTRRLRGFHELLTEPIGFKGV
jgi:hypothetical protein